METAFGLLTFYKFVDIADPHAEVAQHKQFLADIGIKGRIYIGEEGISATVTGNRWQLQAYRWYLASSPYFKDIPDIDTKATFVDTHEFDKLIVRYRSEIVALGKKVTAEQVAVADRQIPVDEFKRIVETEDPEWAILDMRNDYEWQVGHFKGAIPAGTVNFREVPALLEKYKEKLKDKKVAMYCTWGIRCEKLSVLLKDAWLNNFRALNGGVVKYTNTHNDGNWLGNLYTFDGRVSCPIGDATTHTPIGECIYTGTKTDNCENCRYSPCNARIIADPKAYRKHFGFCSQECATRAQQDMQVKNVDRDKFDYKALRSQVKVDPTKKEEFIQQVTSHIRKKLIHVTFNHATPQKEKVLVDW
jgi:UPF0176 protein